MKIVEFDNGKFGVQSRRFPYREFVDMVNTRFEWSYNDIHFPDCQTSLDECEKYMSEMNARVKRTL